MHNPVQDNCGFWIYKELPEGSIPVTVEMFQSGVLTKKNTPYVIYSTIYKEYQCCRVNDTTHMKIIPFVESNRVYLIPTNNHISDSNKHIQPLAELVLEI